jgi:hypothetical protein
MTTTNNATKKWYYEFSSTDKETSKESKYAILKPNRRIREDGELFFASETSRFAKAGVLPKAAWNTILSNGGGSISESERESYGKLLLNYRDRSFELQAILVKSEGNRTEQENKRLDEIIIELEAIKKDIQSFEAEQINIFENTAEAKSRNRTILWWVLQLAYKHEDDKYVPFFDGETFNEKLDNYDIIEETGNVELSDVIKRFTYLTTLWFLGRIETTEDFEAFDKDYLKPTDSAKESVEESVKTDVTITSPEVKDEPKDEPKQEPKAE